MVSSSFEKSNHSQRLLCNGRNSIVTHGFFLFKKTQPQSIIIVEWTRQYSHVQVLYSVRKHNHSQSLLWNGRDSIVTHGIFTLLENTTTVNRYCGMDETVESRTGSLLCQKTQPQSIVIVEWTRQYSHAQVLYSVRKHNHSNSFLLQSTTQYSHAQKRQPQQLIFITIYYTVQSSTEKTTTATHFYYNLLYSIVKHRKENHSNSFYYNLLYSIRGGSRFGIRGP